MSLTFWSLRLIELWPDLVGVEHLERCDIWTSVSLFSSTDRIIASTV